MTPTDIAATSFWPNVARRVPSSASFEEAWDRVVFLSKLLFETGRAEVSVTAEWAAQMLSAHFLKPTILLCRSLTEHSQCARVHGDDCAKLHLRPQ
jgi:hypothetical protein